MARINHEYAIDVLREKLFKLQEERKTWTNSRWIDEQIQSLENTIFTLELDQEPIIFR